MENCFLDNTHNLRGCFDHIRHTCIGDETALGGQTSVNLHNLSIISYCPSTICNGKNNTPIKTTSCKPIWFTTKHKDCKT